MNRLTTFAALFCSLGMTAAVCADEEGLLVVRTYPVSDIVMEVADYPYQPRRASSGGVMGGGGGGSGFGGGGGGAFSIEDSAYPAHAYGAPVRTIQFGGGGGVARPAAPAAPALHTGIDMDGLIEAIVSCIASDSWADNGGGEAEIRPLGGMLIISQAAEVHQQIDGLLDMIRRDAGKRQTIVVDARWLMLNSDELDSLVGEQEGGGVGAVNAEQLDRFTRQASSLRAVATCFSGQLIHLVSGTQRNSVTSYIPVVGAVEQPGEEIRYALRDQRSPAFRQALHPAVAKGVPVQFVVDTQQQRQSSVGYQPVISTVNLGVLLEIRPTVLPDGKAVIVDLASNLTVASKAEPHERPRAGDGLAPPVDRLATETARFASTFRMPVGRPVLVGGLSFSPTAGLRSDDSQDAGETRQAYVVLRIQ